MHLVPADERFLHQSLALAKAAAAFSSPNPTVGCVLAKEDVVLGEGAHRYGSRDHAEIVALKAAAASGTDVRGSTAYVTLEPCSHHGRTGPCADALIAAGVRRCVVATVDPNPLVSGQGIAKLVAAGVEVTLLKATCPAAHEARRLNDAFAFSVQYGRPFITLKAAVSRDGKLAPPAARRTLAAPFWLTGSAARDDVQQLRHAADALMTGIGTVVADDPSLSDRTGLPRRKPLRRVVLDTNLRISPTSKLVASVRNDLIVVSSAGASPRREADLRARGAEVLRVPLLAGKLDLLAVMAALAAWEVRSVLVEAGTALNSALLDQDLVDKLVLYTAPAELGREALPFAWGHSLEELKRRLTSREERRFLNGRAEDHRQSGYLHDPWTQLDL